MRNTRWMFFLFVILVVSACSPVATDQTSVPTKPLDLQLASPAADRTTVTGQMVSLLDGQPFQTTLIRLAVIHGEGVESIYVLNDSTSPGAYTDSNGVFVFENIDPGFYAVLITDSNGNYLTINETADKILTIEAVAGKITETGTIKVDLTHPQP